MVGWSVREGLRYLPAVDMAGILYQTYVRARGLTRLSARARRRVPLTVGQGVIGCTCQAATPAQRAGLPVPPIITPVGACRQGRARARYRLDMCVISM